MSNEMYNVIARAADGIYEGTRVVLLLVLAVLLLMLSVIARAADGIDEGTVAMVQWRWYSMYGVHTCRPTCLRCRSHPFRSSPPLFL